MPTKDSPYYSREFKLSEQRGQSDLLQMRVPVEGIH